MARSTLLAVLALSLLAVGVSGGYPSAAKQRSQRAMPGPPTFVISGRGWGHGVGMAQWGAYGFAQHGASYEDILSHYYRGTTLGPAQVSKVRVYLASGRSQVSLGSNAPFTVRDGIGQTWHVAAGTLNLGPGLRVKTTDVQQPQRLPGPLTFIPGASALRFGSTAYRGQLVVSVANGSLRAINNVGLEPFKAAANGARFKVEVAA